MKKHIKTFTITAIATLLAIFGTLNAYSSNSETNKLKPKYTLDSMTVEPSVIHKGDSVFLYVSLTHYTGKCSLISSKVEFLDSLILVSTEYSKGKHKDIYQSTDIIFLGTFPAGYYNVVFNQKYNTNFLVQETDTIPACNASFDYYFPKCGDSVKCGPNTVKFNDLSSPNVIEWLWNFGDSTFSNEQSPMHQYQSPGQYYVSLTIKTQNNCSSETWQAISIGVPACQANFNYYIPKCGDSVKCGPNTVKFNDLSSQNVIEWLWNFGDSTFSNEQSPIHQYQSPGQYYVSLSIKTENNCSSDTWQTVSIGVPACKASFYYFKTRCNDSLDYAYNTDSVRCNDNIINFINTSSGNIIRSHWNFGDGEESDEMYPSHTYPKALKNWPVSLTIYTSDSCTSMFYDTVYFVQNSCNASFSYYLPYCSDSSYCIGNTIMFNNTSSGYSLEYSWSFGDSTYSNSNEANPIHSFNQAGIYNVCLTINGVNGCSSTYCQNVTVGDIPVACNAYFSWAEVQPDCADSFADCITNGNFVNFNNLSSGDIQYWHWVFGDGECSKLQNPTHTYELAGRYPVTLVISGTDNCSSTFTQWINIGNLDSTKCYANFYASADSVSCIDRLGVRCLQLHDISSPDAVSWLWEFSNGETSTLQNPTHSFVVYPNDSIYIVSLTTTTNSGCVAKITKQINSDFTVLSTTTGIKETSNTSDLLEVFPTPASDFVNLKLPNTLNSDAIVQVISLAGNVIDYQKINLSDTYDNKLNFNVRHLENGNYICRVITKDTQYRGKLIINKR